MGPPPLYTRTVPVEASHSTAAPMARARARMGTMVRPCRARTPSFT